MKKVSVNKWKKMLPKAAPSDREATIHFKGTENTLDIIVVSDLTIEDRMSFAKDVVEACFDIHDGSYIPYAFDISLGIMMVQYFTNVDVGAETKLAFDLVKNTDIIDVIKKNVDVKTMDQIEVEVYELLQWQKSRHMRSTKADELYDALTMLIERFSQMADSAKNNLDDGTIVELTGLLKKFGDQKGLAKAVLDLQNEQK